MAELDSWLEDLGKQVCLSIGKDHQGSSEEGLSEDSLRSLGGANDFPIAGI